jgi:protein phosphatase
MDSLNDRGYILHFCRLHPAGEPPSPRAAHAAAAVGTMVVFQVLGTWDLQIPFLRQLFSVVIYKMVTQGGIGPAGHSTDDLYVLDLTNDKFKWHRLG